MTQTIATIIVTYNRQELLTQCLDAVLAQTRIPDRIIIVDNNSTDGTPEFLQAKGYLEKPIIDYVRLTENTGGAGGFYTGMKRGYEAGYDWLWLTDDDGYPAQDCLEKLIQLNQEFEIIGPAVVSPEDQNILTWKLRVLENNGYFSPRMYLNTYDELTAKSEGGIYLNQANFFNGILVNKNVVKKIGYVIKELFIWGDEYEYYLRCKKFNIKICTQVDAMFFHPIKSVSVNELKFYYLVRNLFYTYFKYAEIMYAPSIRLFYPFYLVVKYLRLTPSFSPFYLAQVIKSVFWAIQGKLIPYN
ncbi:MAG: glycosyltransferase family 2 protein [Gomphosphaeria aponina SAG 52.96 = DSM 107014]|uniref:Glycosyltransferase family 2 protein n=1 Tax=Gomphosphaeria aponina SAG 52.96 = DSM 107014 TaxID=1521640 RepID=A0A941GMS1_9CHRO|nr:glycosyltransferase family 2 protein [Gomphosphaeria aponina SAG 52.96 = DSM 107014]